MPLGFSSDGFGDCGRTNVETNRQRDQSSVKEAALLEGLGGPLERWQAFFVERTNSAAWSQ